MFCNRGFEHIKYYITSLNTFTSIIIILSLIYTKVLKADEWWIYYDFYDDTLLIECEVKYYYYLVVV